MNYVHTNHRRVAAFIVGATVAALGPIAHAQNLLLNPSFELGTFVNRGDGFEILNAGDTSMTAWTVINDTLAWGTTPNSAAIVPFDGSFFLDLQGDGIFGAPYGGVSQSLTTIIGQPYHLSFILGTQQTTPNGQGPVSVSATGGSTTLPFTFDPGGTGTQWGEFGFDFTATSTTSPISIIGTSTAGGAYIGLDFVSVTQTPEPSALALLIGGALMAGLVRNKPQTNRAQAPL